MVDLCGNGQFMTAAAMRSESDRRIHVPGETMDSSAFDMANRKPVPAVAQYDLA